MTAAVSSPSESVKGLQQPQDQFVKEHGVEDLVVRVVLSNGESPDFDGGLRAQFSAPSGPCVLQAVVSPLRYAVFVRPVDVHRVDFEILVPQVESPKSPLGFSSGPADLGT